MPADQGGQPGLAHTAPAVDDEHQDERHEQGQDRRLPPDHGPERVSALASESRGSSLTPEAIGASVTIGIASAPKATGAVLATSATRRGLDRLEAQRHQHDDGDRDRCAEPGERLEQRTEAEGDDDRLDPLVGADLLEGAAQHLEVPGATVRL